VIAVRVFLSMTLTVFAALEWYTVLERVSLDWYADQLVAQVEMETGRKYPAAAKAQLYAIVNKAPSYSKVLPPALVNTVTAAGAWALTFWAIRRRDREEQEQSKQDDLQLLRRRDSQT